MPENTEQERIDYGDYYPEIFIGRFNEDDREYWDAYEDGIRWGEQIGLEADLAGLCLACWTMDRTTCGGPHCLAGGKP